MKASKSTWIRFLCLVASLVMTLSLFVGCGANEGQGTNNPTASATEEDDSVLGVGGQKIDGNKTETVSNTKTSAVSTQGTAGAGQKGKLKIAGQSDSITPNDYKKTDPARYTKAMNLIKEIKDKTGYEIEFYIVADWNQFTKLYRTGVMSNKPIADYCNLDFSLAYPTFMVRGYVAPLASYFKLDDKVWSKERSEPFNYNGKQYGLRTTSDMAPNQVIYFNKDILKSKMGSYNLYDTVKQGKWTWDEFLRIAKACTESNKNDNDVSKIWGAGGGGMMGMGLQTAFIESVNGGWTSIDSRTKSAKFTLDEKNTVAALNFVYDLYHKHNVAKKIADNQPDSIKWEQNEKDFANGKVALYAGELWRASIFKSNNVNYGIVCSPKAITGNNTYCKDYISQTTKGYVGFVPPGIDQNEKFAEALTLWHAKRSWDPSFRKSQEKIVTDTQSIDSLEQMSKILKFRYVGQLPDDISPNMKISEKATPEKFIREVKSKIQANLNKLFVS